MRREEELGPDAARPSLEGRLLSDQPLAVLAQALVCAYQCARCWLIKEFHEALKTGPGAEKLPLQTGARVFATLAWRRVVVLALVYLREKSRPLAEVAGLITNELRVLHPQGHRPLHTMQDVYGA